MSELRKIPNVGETTEQDLIAMGYTTIESLKGKSADELYRIIAPLYDIEIETGVQINARVLLKKMWDSLPFRTPFHVNVMNEGIVL